MCGRYTQKKSKSHLEQRFGVAYYREAEEITPNYNAHPGEFLQVVTMEDPTKMALAEWGIVPEWEKEKKNPVPLINATAERLLEAIPFKYLMAKKRCIVIADGYFEFKLIRKGFSIPYFIQVENGSSFAFAALYQHDPETGQLAFSLITQPANKKLSFIHYRMPAILTMEQEKAWLDESVSAKEAQAIILQYPDDQLSFYAVSREMNGNYDNNPDFIVPKSYEVEEQSSLF